MFSSLFPVYLGFKDHHQVPAMLSGFIYVMFTKQVFHDHHKKKTASGK